MLWTVLGTLDNCVLHSNGGDLNIANFYYWNESYGYYVLTYYGKVRGEDWYYIKEFLPCET